MLTNSSSSPLAQFGSFHEVLRSFWLMDGVANPLSRSRRSRANDRRNRVSDSSWRRESGSSTESAASSAVSAVHTLLASERASSSASSPKLPATVAEAVRNKKLRPLVAWLELCGDEISAVDEHQRNLVHWAACSDFEDAIALLARHGAELNARQFQGATPLFLATFCGNEGAVRALLAAGADPCIGDIHSIGPLHVACRTGATSTIKALLDAGASPSARDESGRTALKYALEFKRKGAVMLFRQHFTKGQMRPWIESRDPREEVELSAVQLSV